MIEKSKVKFLGGKTEFIAIDFFKIICILLVVTIHIPMFIDINSELSFWTNQVLARIAVPFFFIASGYFIGDKICNSYKLISYCKRILIMYIIYTIIYLPVIMKYWITNDRSNIKDIIVFIRDFFLVGSYMQLWYLLGLVVAALILYVSVVKLKLSDKKLIIISSILYCIGVLGDAYKNLFLNIPIIKSLLAIYYKVFGTTRNGLFFGFFFLTLGYLLNKYRYSIKNKINLYIIITLLSFLLMNIEEYFARYITNHTEQNMLFSTPIVVIFLYLSLCFIDVSKKYLQFGIWFRHTAALIFGFHMILSFYISKLIYNIFELNSLEYYLLIIIANIILSIIILLFQKKYNSKLLGYLY